MKRMLLAMMAMLLCVFVQAQLLTWTPPFPKEDDPAQTLVITVDATKGNKGLLNYSPATDVYVHIGVITTLSTNSTDWKYAPFTWGSTTPAANAPSAGINKWKFTINGSLRSYFGITNTSERILKIAILFRNGSGSKKQANADGGDMFIPVYGDTLAVRIDQPFTEPKYTPAAENPGWTVGSSFTVTANASKSSTIKLYHNGTELGSATNAITLSKTSTVTAEGNQQIVAEANDGNATRYDTLNVFVSPVSSPVVALPAGVRDGINYEAGNTSVTLVLRAPGKNKAVVIGDFNNWIQNTSYIMNKTPDGKFFWLRIQSLTPGTEYAYQYVVDDTIRIADPYAEKVLDPNNDPYISAATYPNLKTYPAGQTGIVSVLQTGQAPYNWTVTNFHRPDKKGLVVYELLVRDFVAAHDWKAVTDSLHYLKTLGINAIELMPFNEFEGNISWGYNPDFYFAPDKYYGTENSLKTFIDSCHRLGIAVIMDVALNHSFGSSPMVQLYWDKVNNRPAADNPWFNPVAKHAYNVGFDMNHESTDTKYFFGRVVEHWLQQYKIDGFRFDLAKGFTQKQTCDASGNNCNVDAWSAYDASRIAIWKGYFDTLQNKSAGSYVILEHLAASSEETELANYGMMLWNKLSHNYQEAAMGYAIDLSGVVHAVRNWVGYMESHDEERIVYKNINYGNASGSYNIKDTATALKRMELDAAFLFTVPGPKMIWQFGELGYDYSINYCSNGTINNDCRVDPKPIRWDYLNDVRRKEVYEVYSQLIKLRFHPWYRDAFVSGTVNQSLNAFGKWITVSSGDTSQLVVVGNFDVNLQNVSVTFPSSGTWYDYLKNVTYTATGAAQNISLQPGEYHVYVNRNVNNVTTTPVVNVPWDGETLDAKAFPNPALARYTVELKLPQTGSVHVELYSNVGQHLGSLYDGLLTRGTHRLELDRKSLPAGVYYLTISTKAQNKTIQVTYQ